MSKTLASLLVLAGSFALAPSAVAANWNGWGGWGGGGGGNGCGGGGGNQNNLRCDAGGPYVVGAQGPFVAVRLDGRDSDNETGYEWSTSFPGAIFDDATSARPWLTLPANADSAFEVVVRLTVRNQKGQTSCHTTVRVRDTTAPVIECPPTGKIFCGGDESPAAHGYATATDNVDQNVCITYCDTIQYTDCPADRFDHIVRRRWTARDDAGNTSTCTQLIDVVKEVTSLDVLPGVCPNGYDPDACDLLPVAILGRDGLPVGKIQWNTVKLYGRNCDGGPVSPQCFQYADVAGPFAGGPDCGCDVIPPDGKGDLVAYFNRNKLNQRLGLDCLPAGSTVSVVVTGRLSNGCKFVAEDCLVVL